MNKCKHIWEPIYNKKDPYQAMCTWMCRKCYNVGIPKKNEQTVFDKKTNTIITKEKIKKIPSIKCSKCSNIKMQRVGFTITEGYLCESCNYYYRIKDQRILKVIRIFNHQNSQIFESDLVFHKD